MNPPLPWTLASAEVRIADDIASISVHSLTIRHRLTPILAEAIWRTFGAIPGQVELQVTSDAARVELVRGGLRVHVGPYVFLRQIPFAKWRYLEHRELQAREATERDEETVHVA